MSPELLVGMLAAILALAGMVFSLRNQRSTPESKERQLSQRVTELEGTVRTLLRDHQEDQERIQQMEDTLRDAKTRIVYLEAQLSKYERPHRDGDGKDRLLIALGPERAFHVDLAALRATGLRISRLVNVSRVSLKRTLDRYRRNNDQVKYMHLALHGNMDELGFSDGPTDAVWLSGQLAGVQVLVLMACVSDAIGDLLGVVPYVVSMREGIAHGDAWQFTQVFWSLIADGADPELAFDETLDRVPPAVAEFAEMHCS